jgi:beta-lactamase superfamily II metal-dependent hydrolase
MSLNVNVRMYNVGELGDCFLLTFSDTGVDTHVLIDCGSFRNSKKSIARMQEIARHVKKQLGSKTAIDIVVGTHQHNDHLSGFVHAEAEFRGWVSQVWLPWLDNPKDTSARRIYTEQKKLVSQVKQLYGLARQARVADELYATKDMLGFYSVKEDGGDPEIPAKGIEILKKLGKKEPEYLYPGDTPVLPGFNKEQVKVYVLGPPSNKDLLFDKDPKKGESYDHSLALAVVNAEKMLAALGNRLGITDDRDEEQFPFNSQFKRKEKDLPTTYRRQYRSSAAKWRTIDDDWLQEVDQLALYLDGFTNNSSLVLAFELVQSGKVLLFAADAQTGNWKSWDTIIWKDVKAGFTTKSLLENTVLYKVGHHGSHNSTLVAGLELMKHEELVAMIPVDKNDPNIKGTKPKPGAKPKLDKNGKPKKPRKWKMPAKNLLKRLKEKTGNRVLRMDDGFAVGCGLTDAKATWKNLPNKPLIGAGKLYVEYKING